MLKIDHNVSHLLKFSIDLQTNDSKNCGEFLSITPHQSIVYISDQKNLSECVNGTVTYKLTATDGTAIEHTLVHLTLKDNELVTVTPYIGKLLYTAPTCITYNCNTLILFDNCPLLAGNILL